MARSARWAMRRSRLAASGAAAFSLQHPLHLPTFSYLGKAIKACLRRL